MISMPVFSYLGPHPIEGIQISGSWAGIHKAIEDGLLIITLWGSNPK